MFQHLVNIYLMLGNSNYWGSDSVIEVMKEIISLVFESKIASLSPYSKKFLTSYEKSQTFQMIYKKNVNSQMCLIVPKMKAEVTSII